MCSSEFNLQGTIMHEITLAILVLIVISWPIGSALAVILRLFMYTVYKEKQMSESDIILIAVLSWISIILLLSDYRKCRKE